MLTVDYERLGLAAGDRLLDLGCGGGRHAFEGRRRRASVVALDRDAAELKDVAAVFTALDDPRATARAGAGGPPPREEPGVGAPGGRRTWACVNGDARTLPFADASFERVIAAEVLEHVADDAHAVRELARVLRPGGRLAVTVPSWLPERVCWAITADYHAPAVEGGHVRIYRKRDVTALLRHAGGLVVEGAHRVHALHSPYWWLKCAVGVRNEEAALVRLYHRFLVWDITSPARPVRLAERALDPVLGKSLVVYARKPIRAAA